MRARDIMVTGLETISAETPLLEAVRLLRERKLETGKVDVRCLLVHDERNEPVHVLTEADVIKAILPWFFRDKKFSEKVGQWLSKDAPEASLDELYRDLARAARKKKVKDLAFAEGPIVSIDENDSLLKVAHTMHVERIKTLPVTREGKIVGIAFRAAVFEAIADEIERGKKQIASDPASKASSAS